MKYNMSNAILESINKPLTAEDLFNIYRDIQGDVIEDFADKWNNIKGYGWEVQRERTKLVNPAVVRFVEDYGDEIKDNLIELDEIMCDNNFYVQIEAIKKELGKFE